MTTCPGPARRFLVSLSLTLAALLLATASALAECRDDRVELRGPWGQSAFAVEVADTDASRAQGLMHRPSMPRFSGMLFVFDPPPGPVSFWMENTLIPLDMLFIDQTGRVGHVHHDARPLDRTPIPGGNDVLYVLEINGGMARRLGIGAGSEMRHPRIDPSLAVWPCAD
jgi:uncharacterized membrane protein (UPF0127 family)